MSHMLTQVTFADDSNKFLIKICQLIKTGLMLGSELKILIEYAKMYNFTLTLRGNNTIGFGELGDYWNATPNSVRDLFLKEEVDIVCGIVFGKLFLSNTELIISRLPHFSFKCNEIF